MHSSKHLIIGAGPVGLAHARSLKEAGIPYDQVDADDDVGGNWYHGTYETAHIISSKKVTQYSDWPMPENYPDFPSKQHMLDYFRAYTKEFGLRQNIEFKRKVIYVRPVENNLWEVSFENGEIRRYLGVLVCNGHHWSKRFPTYPGQFDGEWIHSKDYKHPDQLKGKRVLVIGSGNSACDVASEAARVSEKAVMSMRHGTWFLPKTMFGKPITDLPLVNAPVWIQRLFIRISLRLVFGSLKQYGLPKPDYRIFEKHPTISSEVLHYIKHGRLAHKPDVKKLDGQTIHFTDGSKEAFDLVVCATGFYVDYPFLPEELNRVEGPVVKAYGGSMLADYKGLYLIGWSQARGGVGTLVAPTSRLLARFIKLQQEIEIPVGLFLKNMGEKLPETHLFNPTTIFRQVRRAQRLWKFIQKKAIKMDKKHRPFNNPVLSPLPESRKAELAEKSLVVY